MDAPAAHEVARLATLPRRRGGLENHVAAAGHGRSPALAL
jgi:hypothetical protein